VQIIANHLAPDKPNIATGVQSSTSIYSITAGSCLGKPSGLRPMICPIPKLIVQPYRACLYRGHTGWRALRLPGEGRGPAPDHLVPVMSRSRSNAGDTIRQPSASRSSSAAPRPRARPSVTWILPMAMRVVTTREQWSRNHVGFFSHSHA
jgi:hypothetical protein